MIQARRLALPLASSLLLVVGCRSEDGSRSTIDGSNSNSQPAAAKALDNTDASITARATLALLADKATSGFDVDVDTKDGVVALSGRVDTPASKASCETVVNAVYGVKSTRNSIEVTSEAKRNEVIIADEAIEDSIEDAMDNEPALRGLSLAAESKGGVVNLAGTVENREQLASAAQTIRKLPGVRSVVSTEVIITGDKK
jgi:hyperosmotically inducible periplasmic protein